MVRADRQIIVCFTLTEYPYSLQSQLLHVFTILVAKTDALI